MVLGAERSAPEARRAATKRALYLGVMQNRLTSPELDAYARARMDPFYGSVIVEDDPYAPDGRFIEDGPPTDCPLRSGHRVPRSCTGANGHDGPCTFPAPRVRLTAPVAVTDAPAAPPDVPAAAAPVLARPACPRCGQTFRKHGAGYDWHLANRPDCASAVRRLAVA